MSAHFVEHFGTFIQLPDFLHNLKLSPAAKHTYAILAGFKTVMGEAYICRAKIREKLGLALTTISSAVTELEQNSLVMRTGKYKHGSYPIVEVLCGPEAGVSKRQHLSKQTLTEVLAKANPQLETEEIKIKQTSDNVCSKKIVDLEKLTLLESLRGFGVSKNTAKSLITRYGIERVKYQLEHLEEVKKRGDDIKNPAGWLMKAVRKRFLKPKELEQTPQQVVTEEKDEQHRKAHYLLQQAQQEYRLDNLEEAKTLAQRSIAASELAEARELLGEIANLYQKKKHREEALQSIPKQLFEQVLQKKRDEQKTILMKLGILKLGEIGERAAYEATISELQGSRLQA